MPTLSPSWPCWLGSGELELLTIATLRPTGAGPARELERLIERMAQDGRGAVLELEPLDRHEVQALVGAMLGAVPDARVVDAAFGQSRGNPFLAGESMRSLRAAGALKLEHGRAHLSGEVHAEAQPSNAALLGAVFGGDETGVRLAKVVSAFGRFELRHLQLAARLTEQSEDEVSETFDRLVREHLLLRERTTAASSSPTASCATASTKRSVRPSAGRSTPRSRRSLRATAGPAHRSTLPSWPPTSPSPPTPVTTTRWRCCWRRGGR